MVVPAGADPFEADAPDHVLPQVEDMRACRSKFALINRIADRLEFLDAPHRWPVGGDQRSAGIVEQLRRAASRYR